MSEQTNAPLWSRDFVLALVVSFFIGLVFFGLMTTLAVYAVERFAASQVTAGLAASMFIVGSTVARIFAGTLVDVVGRRRILLICLGVFVVASAGYFGADTMALLFALRFVHGAAFGVGTTAVIAIAQGLIPPARRGEGTAISALSMAGATAAGPVLALALVDRSGYPGLFAAIATISVLALATALALREPDLGTRGRRRLRPTDLVERGALPVGAVMLVLGMAFGSVMTFLDSAVQDRGLANGASAYFLSYAAVLIVSRFVMGRMQDVRGDNVVVYPSIAAFAAGMALLAGADSTGTLVLAGALCGLGYGTMISAAQTIVVSAVPPHRLGIAISTLLLFLDLGSGLGPVALGGLVEAVGYRGMYLTMAGAVALTAVQYHVAHGRSDHARRHLI